MSKLRPLECRAYKELRTDTNWSKSNSLLIGNFMFLHRSKIYWSQFGGPGFLK